MKVIGIYRKCDFLTLLGGVFALTGIIFCVNSKTLFAVFCLLFSSFCDGFDGVLARKGKNTIEESTYGVELDSLCDVISFGVLPMMIVLSLVPFNFYTCVASVFFGLCGVIRLAYFNMLAITKKSDGKSFIGFPLIISAIIFPFAFFMLELFDLNIGYIIYPILLVICGILFIIPVKIKKPDTKKKILFSIIGIIILGVLSYLLLSK